jgi:hypothetical protein
MYIVLVSLALFGMLPLAIILYKRSRVKKIISMGTLAKARVYGVITTRRQPQDIVYYFFQAGRNTQQYTGTLTAAVGTYRKGQTVDVYYLPDDPRKHTVKGAWKSNGLVVFGLAIALFMLFAAYKIYEMIQSGEV